METLRTSTISDNNVITTMFHDVTSTTHKILKARRRQVVKLLKAVWNVQKKSKKRDNNPKLRCKT